MQTRKYLHVITHYIPDYHYGGVVESGSKLFLNLRKLGDFRLVAVSKTPERVIKNSPEGSKCYKSLLFHKNAFSVSAILGLWKDIKNVDIVYVNGITTFLCTLAQLYSLLQKKPYALATHGLTHYSYNQKKWKKILYFKFIVFPLLKRAEFIRVTSNSEIDFLKSKRFSKYFLSTNAIEFKEFENLPDDLFIAEKYKYKFVFMFMGRMSREKGLDILIEAYREFCSGIEAKNHILLLVGPDSTNYLGKLAIDYKKESIEYIPGVYNKEKINIFRQSDVVILPSYSENFGNVVAEAFACERPVITTTGTPWNEIMNLGCGLYINPNKNELLEAMLRMYHKTPQDLQEMGMKGRKYILNNFDWKIKSKDLFNRLEEIKIN